MGGMGPCAVRCQYWRHRLSIWLLLSSDEPSDECRSTAGVVCLLL